MGELFLGAFLGLGSEGNVGAHRPALLHYHAAWATRRLVDGIWSSRSQRGLLSRRADGVVRREFCARKRVAQLWLRYRWRDVRGGVCNCGSLVRRVCDLAVPG